MKGRNRWLAVILASALCLAGGAGPGRGPAVKAEAFPTLEVVFFNVGKADSMLIRQGEHAMLIDAATDKLGKRVLERLAEEGVEKLDVMILTHEDKDHIGGADRVLRGMPVERVCIGDIRAGGKRMRQFEEALAKQGREAERLYAGDRFPLGEARVTVIGPLSDGHPKENDRSLVVRVEFGETVFLFTGDAEERALAELLDAPDASQTLRANVLKVPHHGRWSAASAAFFAAVRPEIAVICCERDTSDRLPDDATLYALDAAGASIHVTGDGEVRVISDGERISVP